MQRALGNAILHSDAETITPLELHLKWTFSMVQVKVMI